MKYLKLLLFTLIFMSISVISGAATYDQKLYDSDYSYRNLVNQLNSIMCPVSKYELVDFKVQCGKLDNGRYMRDEFYQRQYSQCSDKVRKMNSIIYKINNRHRECNKNSY